jgi:Integrase zinc binding domain
VGLASLLEPYLEDRIPTGAEVDAATITTEELRKEQAVDHICNKLLLSAEKYLLYDLNEVGILVRKSPFDGSQQIMVPQSLVSRVLYLEHYPTAAGHPGAHRMFHTIRKTFFCPCIAEDVYETVRQCDLCARNRISEKRNANPLKGPRERAFGVRCDGYPRTALADETRKLLSLGDQRPLLKGYKDGPPANSYRFVGRPSILRPLGLRVRTAGLPPDRQRTAVYC